MSDINTTPELVYLKEPKNIRHLQRLVTVLTTIMILGFIIIIGTIVVKVVPNKNDRQKIALIPNFIKLESAKEVNSFIIRDNAIYLLVSSLNGNQEIIIVSRSTGEIINRSQILLNKTKKPKS
jgi:hypothetical protein